MNIYECSHLGFANYLTESQQNCYYQFDSSLQCIVLEDLLGSGDPEKLDLAYTVFDLFDLCKVKNLEETLTVFLITLLQLPHGDAKRHLSKVLEICKNHGGHTILTCATTKKNTHYSIDVLIEIIDKLYQIYCNGNQLFLLSNLPYYDEGAKEILDQILDGSYQNRILTIQKEHLLNKQNNNDHTINYDEMFKNCFTYDEVKSNTIQFLTSLPSENRSTMNHYLKFLDLLKEDLNTSEFFYSDSVVLIKLLLSTTTRQKSPISFQASLEDFTDLQFETKKLCENYGGNTLMMIYCSNEFKNTGSFNALIEVIKLLNKNSLNFDIQNAIDERLDQFSQNLINSVQFIEAVEKLSSEQMIDLSDDTDIPHLLEKFSQVNFPLSDENLAIIGHQYDTVQKYCVEWGGCSLDQLQQKAFGIRKKAKTSDFNVEDILSLIAIGRLALRIKFSVYLYNTQIMTLLGLLISPNGSIAQVKTGEGKSMIVALFAFVLAMQDKRIHIISSSQQFAIRDEKTTTLFFKAFGLMTSNICQRQPAIESFCGDVIYGTATDFQFSLLHEMLNIKKLFPEKLDALNAAPRFDVVIIDEVDNLTIDTSMHGVRLSLESESSHDWVYPPIFQFVQRKFSLTSEDLDTPVTINDLKLYLQNHLDGRFSASLGLISDEQLKTWINSAHAAIFKFIEKESYVLKQEEDSQGRLVNKIIVIDSKNTGRLMHGMRWSKGIHEFVEIKHGIEIEQESLTPLSMFNTIFYKMYKSCFGLTGTLGLISERESIKEVYNMDSFDVPPHRPLLRLDKAPVILKTNAEQLQSVLTSIQINHHKMRPILLLCESVQESEIFQTLLENANIACEIFNEMQEKSEEEIIGKAGSAGAITIATNNSGRGTDIKLDHLSLENGGLHVILTYYPESQRVEDQARGRAGRQGQWGSSEIILSAEKLKIESLPSDISDPEIQKAIVDHLFSKRKVLGDLMKENLSCRTKIERHVFSLASNFFHDLAEFQKLSEDEKFLDNLAKDLSYRRLLVKKEPDFSHLNVKDLQIAKDIFKLIVEGGNNINLWKTILKQAVSRIKNKMIVDWALNFYNPIQDLINDSNFYQDTTANVLRKFFESRIQNESNHFFTLLCQSLLEELKITVSDEVQFTLSNLIEDIDKLYEKRKVEWNKYLLSSGDGIMHFIRELTDLSLENLGGSRKHL
ncbi:MAG: hypothetical protein H0V82_08295 [Candidatus Protochlamydia sp.]|nr:hypothetical protein [Candidatus Protochlamydia sp.]